MERFAEDLEKIKKNLWAVRDDEVRRKARLLMRVMESRISVRLGCDQNGLCCKTFYEWLNRLRRADHDLAALKNKTRRPKSSPRRFAPEIEKRLCELREEHGGVGGRIVAEAYRSESNTTLSHSGIDKVFARLGLAKKRRRVKLNLHKKRYASAHPLDRVQFDTLWLGIEDSDGNRVYTVDSVDCATRYAFAHTTREQGTDAALQALEGFLVTVGRPKLIQTDNGIEFTNRFTSELNPKRLKPPRPAAFEGRLSELGIAHALIKPRTPQLNGKVERFHRTLLRWIHSRNLHGRPFAEIETAVQHFMRWYNETRPHSALNYLPPAAAFFRTPPSRAA